MTRDDLAGDAPPEKPKKTRTRKSKAPNPEPHGPLRIGLSDPGMTPLLRAGLGGLAASLRARLLEQDRNATWPAPVSLGGGTFTVEPRAITIDCSASTPETVLRALFEHAFRLTKEGIIDLPGSYDPVSPPDIAVRAAMQAALKRTFLQHGLTTKKAASGLRTASFTIDDQVYVSAFQPFLSFAHQDALAVVLDALDSPIELAGWAYPGASQKHVKFGETRQEYDLPTALCALFALVGTMSLDVPRGGCGALVIPEPEDLVIFASARPRLTPKDVGGLHLAGLGDAVLGVQLVLRMESVNRSRAVRSVDGALLRATPWASQQKSRIRTLHTESLPDTLLTAYDLMTRALPTRFHRVAPKKGDEGGYFATPSVLRAFIADNLASGRRWFDGFATATTSENPARFLHYYRTKDNLGALWADERKGLIVMLEHLETAEKVFVRSVHIALRQRFGAIAEETQGDPPATRKNRFKGERDRWRLAFAGAKTHGQIRAALADLWSRAGSNAELQAHWEAILPLLHSNHWEAARDLGLVALASYRGRSEEEDDSDESDASTVTG